ncbi:MAG: hypothetical protein WDM96_15840 [Lacunisphaera sp.]
MLAELARGGQAEAELRITGNRHTREPDLPAGDAVRDAEARGLVPLARAHDGEAVAASREAVDKAAERHGDAVDFGSVGFGYEYKMQLGRPGRRRPASRRAQGKTVIPALRTCVASVTIG